MAVEGFDEIFNTIYIAKKLCDMGKYELVTESFFDGIDLDMYYENMYELISNLFTYYGGRYCENRCVELHVLSDPVIVDFYTLAGEYGRRHKIPDKDNSYIKAAEQEVHRQLDFSYCLDWILMGHTEPKRPFHSRLGLLIYQDDWVDLGCLAYGLIEIYDWFSDACSRLKDVLRENKSVVTRLREEAVAA